MADLPEAITWLVEDIPNEDRLFMRVERSFVSHGKFGPGVFKNRPTKSDGMSTDWDKYSTPGATRERAKVPQNNGVIEMPVAEVRKIMGQTVVHRPIQSNRSHTEVLGPKDEEVRLKLRRVARWVDGFQVS